MASGSRRAIAAIALTFGCAALASAAVQQQTGTFALYRGTPQVVSKLVLEHTGSGNELDVVQYPLHSTQPITRYAETEARPLHVIVVRDDFRSFSHVHAILEHNGHFDVHVALDAGHRYYAFVGSKPAGMGTQVFRFVLQAGQPPHHVYTAFEAPSRSIDAGPYRVQLNADRVAAGRPARLFASVTRSGTAFALHPFYGALAHALFINPATLEFVHVDAKPYDAGKAVALALPALRAGIYRMWLQFDDGKSIFTAPFTLAVE